MNRIVRFAWDGRWRRWITIALATMLVVGCGMLAYVVRQHRFDVRTESFTFESGGNTLAATLHLPKSDGPHGVVVFVPGDGTSDADPGALPIWESLADEGYATVKWHKPGLRGSSGNWLDQDMSDRADEVVDVLEALADRPDLDVDDLGVIGLSQGGWVIPLVADRVDVGFFVAWSTAVDWTQQGRFLTDRELENADADPELSERVRAADRSDRGDTYLQYEQWYDGLDSDVRRFFEKMSEDRWRFVERNQDLDGRETLPAMAGTPVLLLLGEQDDNVDVDDTERVYREILGGPCLSVIRYPDGNHELLDNEGLGLAFTVVFRPRNIFADGMLDDIAQFAAAEHSC